MYQFSSVVQLCSTLCDTVDCSTPGFPVYHQLPELAQTLVHWISDAIQPSHPLSSPSPPAFSLCQHQGLLMWYYLVIEKKRNPTICDNNNGTWGHYAKRNKPDKDKYCLLIEVISKRESEIEKVKENLYNVTYMWNLKKKPHLIKKES